MDKKQTFRNRFSNKKLPIGDFCVIAKCCYINHLAFCFATVLQYNCSELTRQGDRFPDKCPFLGVFHVIFVRVEKHLFTD
nr:MAG TPA: hypothetical protein [Caudoviricetes sp.]